MEPTEAQYLVINALETLDLVILTVYDSNTGTWFLETLSLSLPFCRLMPDGEILPLEANYE